MKVLVVGIGGAHVKIMASGHEEERQAARIVENVGQPMELAHPPYKEGRTFEDFLGEAARERMGSASWAREVASVVALLQAALEPDYVVLGGGNVRLLAHLPPGCRRGDNANVFSGGFRLWGEDAITV